MLLNIGKYGEQDQSAFLLMVGEYGPSDLPLLAHSFGHKMDGVSSTELGVVESGEQDQTARLCRQILLYVVCINKGMVVNRRIMINMLMTHEQNVQYKDRKCTICTLTLKLLNKQLELLHYKKQPEYRYFKVASTTTCNKNADCVDQRSDCTFCAV